MHTGSEIGRDKENVTTRILVVLSAICLIGAQVPAPSKTAPSEIQYVGAVSIQPSQDAKVLADWYERFGFQTHESKGGYYGMFQTAAGPFFFAIHPHRHDASAKSSGSVSVVFRVSNYDSYLANAAKNNVVPKSTESDSTGRFAHFIDPDGNEVTIWGT